MFRRLRINSVAHTYCRVVSVVGARRPLSIASSILRTSYTPSSTPPTVPPPVTERDNTQPTQYTHYDKSLYDALDSRSREGGLTEALRALTGAYEFDNNRKARFPATPTPTASTAPDKPTRAPPAAPLTTKAGAHGVVLSGLPPSLGNSMSHHLS